MTLLGFVSMVVLALQIGVQPFVNKQFVGKEVNKGVYVIAMEGVKTVLCLFVLFANGRLGAELKKWRFQESIRVAGVPATTYAIQNILMQQAYQNTDPIVFNLVSQTKVLFTALLLYKILHKPQSPQQILALMMITTAACLATVDDNTPTNNTTLSTLALILQKEGFVAGMVPLIAASILSGVSAVVSQKALQGLQRDSCVFTIELGAFGSIFLLFDILFRSSLNTANTTTVTRLLDGFEPTTMIPMVSSALGGICVGMVTKHAGAVQKGISIASGICLTAFFQLFATRENPSVRMWVMLLLIVVGSVVHSAFPARSQEKGIAKTKKEQ